MIGMIQQKLNSYQVSNSLEEEQAIKEIIQEIALYALWRSGFFELAAFQGGTSLRILHGLPRFSEDLDFILKESDPGFSWQGYLEKLVVCFDEFGLKTEALPKGRIDNRVKKAIIKDTSVVNQLNLSFYRGNPNQKFKIKLEIDVAPPKGSGFEYSYLDFPLDYEVCHQNLESNFSLKIHALLCRPYLKGRDWYDFNWYVKQGVLPNYKHLESALVQYGPWVGQVGLGVDKAWLSCALKEKIASIDWSLARDDVERFLTAVDRQSLSLWGDRFFYSKVDAL